MTSSFSRASPELVLTIARFCPRTTRRALAETSRRCCEVIQPLLFHTVNVSSVIQLEGLTQFVVAREDIRRGVHVVLINAKDTEKGWSLSAEGDITNHLMRLLVTVHAHALCFKGLGGSMDGLQSKDAWKGDSLGIIVQLALTRGLQFLRIIDSCFSIWNMVDILLAIEDRDFDKLELVW